MSEQIIVGYPKSVIDLVRKTMERASWDIQNSLQQGLVPRLEVFEVFVKATSILKEQAKFEGS